MTYEDGKNSLKLFEFYKKITKNDVYLERSFGLVLGMILMQSAMNKIDVFILSVCLIVVIISLVLTIINGVDSKQKFKNESWFTNDDEELRKFVFIENILQIIAMITFVILLIILNIH